MISLQEVFSGNPFADHPQLRTIWPAEFAVIAEEAAVESLEEAKHGDIGGLFLVAKDDQIIGITGYFYCEDIDEPFLRWHGIIPAERGNGYSGIALRQVVDRIKDKLPAARGLTELVPQNGAGPEIEKHFVSLGFTRNGVQEKYDWSPYAWQPIRLDLTT